MNLPENIREYLSTNSKEKVIADWNAVANGEPGISAREFVSSFDLCEVKRVDKDAIVFSNGWSLASFHQVDCCERHYLDFEHVGIDDFVGLLFDLNSPDFFSRVDGYGITLNPTNGWPIRIPGYGSNNGWYSSEMELILYDQFDMLIKEFDISECQDISQA